MDGQTDGGTNKLKNSPKQATLFPTFQAYDMTFLPDKNKTSTECRTPKGERVSLCPKLEKGQDQHMHPS